MNQSTLLSIMTKSLRRIDNIYFECTERHFCYEFYHQLSIELFYYNKNNNDYLKNRNIILSAETQKQLSGYKYPDFLLHKFDDYSQQLMAIEVKKFGNLTKENFQHDLEKLTAYKNNLSYKNIFFLVINTSMKKLEKYILELNLLNISDDLMIITKCSNKKIETKYIKEF
ncbi:hypothetical protein O8C76_06420 [Aliarcobacter butzleri]|uniref:Uncharacterized protein n=1 Tax=Aliarcobacter butzleri TaxID=28197 RepID=A0AAW7PYJ6_9BACT|nr:hypothetical protein [Aliarcobacter butzleri]MDN5070663.1 hypothetical protein [Aliarcobacter butzleri]